MQGKLERSPGKIALSDRPKSTDEWPLIVFFLFHLSHFGVRYGRQAKPMKRVNKRAIKMVLVFSIVLFPVLSLLSNQVKVGVLLMAHGADSIWNSAVEEAVQTLRDFCPIAISFGMADPRSLEKAIQVLEAQGVGRIAVVRLFVSGDSFRHQTEYFLGVRPDPPAQLILNESHHSRQRTPDQAAIDLVGAQDTPPPIDIKATLSLNQEGLSESNYIADILVQRVQSLSRDYRRESVLILAHGEGDEEANRRWLIHMEDIAEKVRSLGLFRAVWVETLREDWEKKRLAAERRIRQLVKQGNEDEGRVIVVPFRVFGFGPYGEVLKGLSYVCNGVGLLPHPFVTEWIRNQAEECFEQAGWKSPFAETFPSIPGEGR